MAKLAYNNVKNAIIGHTLFKLNCAYYLCLFIKEDINSCFSSKLADKWLAKLQDLITVCQKNLYHTQGLLKQVYNKNVKPRSYISSDKVWLDSKYIKTKQNRMLEAKLFEPFWVLYLIGNQIYKLKLLKKWKIYNIFYVLLLE